MKPKPLAPIYIIRKKAGGHAAHHGGAWKVAYADFVTAMMAFFMVMWLVNQDPSVKKAIAGYFRDPGVFAQERSQGILPGGRPGIEPGQTAQRSPYHSTSDSVREEQRTLAKTMEGVRSAVESMRDVADLRDQVEFAMTTEGLRVELVDKPGSSFFGSGSPVLLGESKRLLEAIAAEIGKLDNDVIVEGHTDSLPYSSSAWYTNWDLSSDRALAAQKILKPFLKPTQLKGVRGLGDTELHIADHPLDPRNRRVSILVRSKDAAAIADAMRGAVAPPSPVIK